MRAVRRTSPGTVEVCDVEVAEPGSDEVLVDIEYAGVNPLDAQVLRGEIGPNPDRLMTLGAEATARLDGRLVLVTGGLGAGREASSRKRRWCPGPLFTNCPRTPMLWLSLRWA